MIKEFNFKFDELIINLKEIGSIMGYGNDPLPAPFDSYVELALSEAQNLTDIRSTCRIIEGIHINNNEFIIQAGKHKFYVGKTVCNELIGAERLAFYVCTAGKTISEKAANLLYGNEPVLGYVYDVLGSIIVEASGELIQTFVKKEIENNGDLLTNRYSPGYCQWPVSDQYKLFSFFSENICGVSLTDSALMYPLKSTSGVIGIGKNVKFREYICNLCSSKDCIYRKIKK